MTNKIPHKKSFLLHNSLVFLNFIYIYIYMKKTISIKMKILDYLTQTFGFTDFTDFSQSFIHQKFLLLTLPSAMVIGGFFEKILGITTAMLISFIVLAILEIVTGLSAARVKKIRWESKKFSRFGLKIFVWLCLIFVANSFAKGYAGTEGVLNYLAQNLFAYLHAVLVCYVTFEYLISVVENLSVLTGQSNNKLIGFFKRKFNGFLGEVESIKPNQTTFQKPKDNDSGSDAVYHDNDGDAGADGGDGGSAD